MPTPKKGRRFGGDPAHQRLLMANLAVAASSRPGDLTTTVAKAKALRPYAEQLITKAKNGGVHQQRQVSRRSTTRTSPTSCSPRSARATATAAAATCASSSSVPAPATTRPWRASSWSEPALRSAAVSASPVGDRVATVRRSSHGRLRRHRLPRVRRATRHAHRRRRADAPRSRACCAATSKLACAGRTDAGVHARGQVVSCAVPPRSTSIPSGSSGAVNGQLAPGDRGARPRAGRCRRSTPGTRPAGAPTATRREPTRARSLPRPDRLVGARARSTWRACASPRTRSSANTTSHRSAGRAHRAPRPCVGYSNRVARPRRRGAPLRHPATAFCWQMVRSIVGTARRRGCWARSAPGDILRIVRALDRSAAGRVAVPQGLCLWEVGY